MEYKIARSYEDMGYTIIDGSIYEKNGKMYADLKAPCHKCGGKGEISYFAHVDEGVCFCCGGAGYFKKKDARVYTEAEREKMDAATTRKREAKLAKEIEQAPAKIKAWKDKYNISDGNIFIVAGCNTFEIKDMLKQLGAKYYGGIGWFFGTETAPVDNSEFPEGAFLFHCTVDDVFTWSATGSGPYFKDNAINEINEDINAIKKANNKAKYAESEYYGEVGDRIKKATATFVSGRCVTSDWGSSNLYTFTIDNNVFIWFSQAVIDSSINPGDKIVLSGTVKTHKEYNGIKQTYLSRCIVKPA